MKRKQFKRNVQQQRQRRSVTYMREQDHRVYQKRETLKNCSAGIFVGLFVAWILLEWLA